MEATVRDQQVADVNPVEISRSVLAFFILTLLGMLVFRTSATVVDPDLWHEMALGRETVRQGQVPWQDTFAYTPTVYPSVHHEWGTGFIAYLLVETLGEAGLSCLNLGLILGLAWVCWVCSREGGASVPVSGSFAILAIFIADYGFSPIRAQMFSFLFTALLCFFVQTDQRGDRRWIPFWLVAFIVWLNLHAGFLLGAGLFFCCWLEQLSRSQPHRHLLVTGLMMFPLMLINPYGVHYLNYLWSAVRLDRPLISEWGPIWHAAEIHSLIAFAAALVVFLVSLRRIGWKHYPGVMMIAVTAAYAIMHVRMLPFFAITWMCFVPRHFENTVFGNVLKDSFTKRPWFWRLTWSGSVLAVAIANLSARPWDLRVPGLREIDGESFSNYYPVGPVEYMEEMGYRGNLLLPFDFGAYVIWKTDSRVLVSIDSRYEVAYPPGSLERNYRLFKTGREASRIVNETTGTQAILVPDWSPLKQAMNDDPSLRDHWELVYQDEAFLLYAEESSAELLEKVDSRGKVYWGRIP